MPPRNEPRMSVVLARRIAPKQSRLPSSLWIASAVALWAMTGRYARNDETKLLAPPEHVLGRDQPAAGNQQGRERDVGAGLRIARENEKRGGEQRRRIGGGAEHTDVAALHADVPGVEGSADRPDAEPDDREPLRQGRRPYRDLDHDMREGGECRGG